MQQDHKTHEAQSLDPSELEQKEAGAGARSRIVRGYRDIRFLENM